MQGEKKKGTHQTICFCNILINNKYKNICIISTFHKLGGSAQFQK